MFAVAYIKDQPCVPLESFLLSVSSRLRKLRTAALRRTRASALNWLIVTAKAKRSGSNVFDRLAELCARAKRAPRA